MATDFPITGEVTSWTNNTQLVSTGIGPFEFSLTQEAEEGDTTRFGETVAATHTSGLAGVTIEMVGQLKTPAFGDLGLVTFSEGHVVNCNHWTLTLEADVQEKPIFAQTAKEYAFGLYTGQGTFGGWLDSTTPVEKVASAIAEAVLKYQEVGGTDNTLTGHIFARRLSVGPVTPRRLAPYEYGFRLTRTDTGTGALTHSALSAGIFPSGAVARPVAGTLTLQAFTGRTYAISAGWRSISIECAVNQLTTVRITAQGTGAFLIDGA